MNTNRILITGAGSGLGRALALQYARNGVRIACTDRDAASAAETLRMVEERGGSGLAMALDVTREEDFAAARQRIEADWEGLDLLVNNAGVATAGAIDEAPLSDWHWVLDINLLGVVRGCKVFAPLFKRQGAGHVVNIASFAGIANPPAMASYNVAKAGVVSLSETLLHEFAPHGVAVSVVCPAFFPTNLMNHARVTQPAVVGMVNKFMKKSGVTAEGVAAQIAEAVRRGQFLVLTHKDTRSQALVKRLAPKTFYRMMQKTTAKWGRKPAP